jgi:hypothetical protein
MQNAGPRHDTPWSWSEPRLVWGVGVIDQTVGAASACPASAAATATDPATVQHAASQRRVVRLGAPR